MNTLRVIVAILCIVIAFLCHVIVKLVERTDRLKKKVNALEDASTDPYHSPYMVNARLKTLEELSELLQQEYIENSNKITRLLAESRAKKDISVFDSR